jgi:hypothetical protein
MGAMAIDAALARLIVANRTRPILRAGRAKGEASHPVAPCSGVSIVVATGRVKSRARRSGES